MIFDIDHDSTGLTKPVKRRPISAQEQSWIRELVERNNIWADVDLGEMFVIAVCTCGCRTVDFERPSVPQNARTASLFHESVGAMWIFVDTGKTIGIELHAKHGSLGELEVVYDENATPWPTSWREVSRRFGGLRV